MAASVTWSVAATVIGIGFIYIKYFRAKHCRSTARLEGKTVIVTGKCTMIFIQLFIYSK